MRNESARITGIKRSSSQLGQQGADRSLLHHERLPARVEHVERPVAVPWSPALQIPRFSQSELELRTGRGPRDRAMVTAREVFKISTGKVATGNFMQVGIDAVLNRS